MSSSIWDTVQNSRNNLKCIQNYIKEPQPESFNKNLIKSVKGQEMLFI